MRVWKRSSIIKVVWEREEKENRYRLWSVPRVKNCVLGFENAAWGPPSRQITYMYSGSNYMRELTWISPSVLDCTTAVDLVFVVDSSGSIGEENFKTVKKVLDKLIRHFSVSASYARIGIVQYATNARVIYTLGRSQRLGFHRLAKRVRSLFYTRGGTKTGKGLELAYKMLHRSKRRLDGKFLKHEQVLLIIYSLYIATVTCKVTGKSYRVEEGISFFSPLLFEHHTLFTIFYYLLINSTRPYIQGHSVTLLTIPTRLQSYFTDLQYSFFI